MDRKVRVRFAPSTTGPLHIGGVRTALYNYLFAKKHGGDFILRIEDTDQTRFVEGAEEYIIDALKWCGMEFDESVIAGGEYGPYRQSERKELYLKHAKQLIESGHAYYAFDTSEELDSLRAEAEKDGNVFTYNHSSRNSLNNSLTLSKEDVEAKIANNTAFVVRFKMPEQQEVVMQDMVRGEVKVNTSALDDKILFKSDGMPTYHLANIVDDYMMKISHVIRGEEWLPSLPLHVLLYEAFGWKKEMPEFAHLPILLKPVGKGKLSKRDGDKLGFPVFPTFWKAPNGDEAQGYRENGYLPDAFINMLALLGWNPGTEQEIFSMEELIEAFSIDRVGRSGARFSPDKPKWFNHQYIQKMDNDKVAELFLPFLQEKGNNSDIKYVSRVTGLVKERATFISDLWDQSSFFFTTPEEYDAKFAKKQWKETTPDIIKQVTNVIEETIDFTSANIETSVKEWITNNELPFGKVLNPMRLAIVGAGKGPHLFDIIEMIGKEESVKRLNNAVEKL